MISICRTGQTYSFFFFLPRPLMSPTPSHCLKVSHELFEGNKVYLLKTRKHVAFAIEYQGELWAVSCTMEKMGFFFIVILHSNLHLQKVNIS